MEGKEHKEVQWWKCQKVEDASTSTSFNSLEPYWGSEDW